MSLSAFQSSSAFTLGDNALHKVQGTEAIIKYTFKNRLLLWEALQASGSGIGYIGDRNVECDGNKNLAIVGDRVLEIILSLNWRESRTHRVYFDRARKVAENENLKLVGNRAGLQNLINKNRGTPVVGRTTMSATVEAILGAVFLDCGDLDAVRKVMQVLGLVTAWKSEGIVEY